MVSPNFLKMQSVGFQPSNSWNSKELLKKLSIKDSVFGNNRNPVLQRLSLPDRNNTKQLCMKFIREIVCQYFPLERMSPFVFSSLIQEHLQLISHTILNLNKL